MGIFWRESYTQNQSRECNIFENIFLKLILNIEIFLTFSEIYFLTLYQTPQKGNTLRVKKFLLPFKRVGESDFRDFSNNKRNS